MFIILNIITLHICISEKCDAIFHPISCAHCQIICSCRSTPSKAKPTNSTASQRGQGSPTALPAHSTGQSQPRKSALERLSHPNQTIALADLNVPPQSKSNAQAPPATNKGGRPAPGTQQPKSVPGPSITTKETARRTEPIAAAAKVATTAPQNQSSQSEKKPSRQPLQWVPQIASQSGPSHVPKAEIQPAASQKQQAQAEKQQPATAQPQEPPSNKQKEKEPLPNNQNEVFAQRNERPGSAQDESRAEVNVHEPTAAGLDDKYQAKQQDSGPPAPAALDLKVASQLEPVVAPPVQETTQQQQQISPQRQQLSKPKDRGRSRSLSSGGDGNERKRRRRHSSSDSPSPSSRGRSPTRGRSSAPGNDEEEGEVHEPKDSPRKNRGEKSSVEKKKAKKNEKDRGKRHRDYSSSRSRSRSRDRHKGKRHRSDRDRDRERERGRRSDDRDRGRSYDGRRYDRDRRRDDHADYRRSYRRGDRERSRGRDRGDRDRDHRRHATRSRSRSWSRDRHKTRSRSRDGGGGAGRDWRRETEKPKVNGQQRMFNTNIPIGVGGGIGVGVLGGGGGVLPAYALPPPFIPAPPGVPRPMRPAVGVPNVGYVDLGLGGVLPGPPDGVNVPNNFTWPQDLARGVNSGFPQLHLPSPDISQYLAAMAEAYHVEYSSKTGFANPLGLIEEINETELVFRRKESHMWGAQHAQQEALIAEMEGRGPDPFDDVIGKLGPQPPPEASMHPNRIEFRAPIIIPLDPGIITNPLENSPSTHSPSHIPSGPHDPRLQYLKEYTAASKWASRPLRIPPLGLKQDTAGRIPSTSGSWSRDPRKDEGEPEVSKPPPKGDGDRGRLGPSGVPPPGQVPPPPSNVPSSTQKQGEGGYMYAPPAPTHEDMYARSTQRLPSLASSQSLREEGMNIEQVAMEVDEGYWKIVLPDGTEDGGQFSKLLDELVATKKVPEGWPVYRPKDGLWLPLCAALVNEDLRIDKRVADEYQRIEDSKMPPPITHVDGVEKYFSNDQTFAAWVDECVKMNAGDALGDHPIFAKRRDKDLIAGPDERTVVVLPLLPGPDPPTEAEDAPAVRAVHQMETRLQLRKRLATVPVWKCAPPRHVLSAVHSAMLEDREGIQQVAKSVLQTQLRAVMQAQEAAKAKAKAEAKAEAAGPTKPSWRK